MTDKGDNSNNGDEEPKAIKMAKELQKEKRESEQLNIDPEQVLKSKRKGNRNLQMNKWMESILSKKDNLMIIAVYPISVLILFYIRLSVF